MVSVAETLRTGANCRNWILSGGLIASFVLARVPDRPGERDCGNRGLIAEAAPVTSGMPCGGTYRSDLENWSYMPSHGRQGDRKAHSDHHEH